jgi:hypothetical protein
MRKNIALQTQIKVVHLVTPYPGAEEIELTPEISGRKGVTHLRNITAWLNTGLGDAVTKEHNTGIFFEKGKREHEASHGCEEKKRSFHKKIFRKVVLIWERPGCEKNVVRKKGLIHTRSNSLRWSGV